MAAPIYLLGDSQPLFWRHAGQPYFSQILASQQKSNNHEAQNQGAKNLAVYIGASNGDLREYFYVFSEAMADFSETLWLKADTLDQQDRLLEADLILLAGGDVELGWEFIAPLKPQLEAAHHSGTVLVGVSAGAIHLGAQWWHKDESQLKMLDTLAFVPALVAAHEEAVDWQPIRSAILAAANQQVPDAGRWPALGLPFGSAVSYNNGIFESCFSDSAGKQAVKFEKVGGDLITTYF